MPLLAVPRRDATAFKSFAGIEREKLSLTSGKKSLLIVGDEHQNHTRWPSSATALTPQIAMGSLVDAPSMQPSEHIYVGSKAPWLEITDDLPQHDELD